MTARRLADLLPHLILPPHEAVIILILRHGWRKHRHWRGRHRALYRSLRNSGNPRARTEAVIRTGREYARELEATR